jgi:phage tail sheath gpL-like
MGRDDGEIAATIAATLTVGPTSEGMVRIQVEGEGVDLPMDFDPDEAEEIADELRAAAGRARTAAARKAPAHRDGRRRR